MGAIVLYVFALLLWLGTLALRARVPGRPASETVRDAVRLVLAWAGAVAVGWPEYYLGKTEEGRRLFKAVPVKGGRPDYVLATTRFQDHLRAPGKLVFTVERGGRRSSTSSRCDSRPASRRAREPYPLRASSIFRSRSEAILSRSRLYSSSSRSSSSRSAALRRAE